MHDDGMRGCFAVDASDIALGVLDAHQPVHLGDGRERRLHRILQGETTAPRRRDLDKGAEQRPGAA